MEKPIISIVVPTLNCASELKKTLESLKKQEYIGFECVIVDGNSTDHTVIVAEEYKNKVNSLHLRQLNRYCMFQNHVPIF